MVKRSAKQVFSTADVARAVGCTAQAIKIAEAMGRIPEARRDEVGHRLYTAADLERARAAMQR